MISPEECFPYGALYRSIPDSAWEFNKCLSHGTSCTHPATFLSAEMLMSQVFEPTLDTSSAESQTTKYTLLTPRFSLEPISLSGRAADQVVFYFTRRKTGWADIACAFLLELELWNPVQQVYDKGIFSVLLEGETGKYKELTYEVYQASK